jgi:PKD repeat protein
MKRQFLVLASVIFLMAGSGCYKKTAVPVADFNYHSTNDSIVPDTVTFHNLSQNAVSYEWNFGDAATSTATDPVHIFTAAGQYTVELKAYSTGKEQWSTKKKLIVVQ